MANEPNFAEYVIVGGGICGLCIVQELDELLQNEEVAGTSDHRIIFVTGRGGFVKRVVNAEQLGQVSMSFDVESSKANDIFRGSRRIKSFHDDVLSWDPIEKLIGLRDGLKIRYEKLAIATGASPKRALPSHSRVIRLRDTQTIKELEEQLKDTRRILIIGNGGIASELVFEMKNVEIVWAIRHSSISATYFDAAAASFFSSSLAVGRSEKDEKFGVKRSRFTQQYEQQKENDAHESVDDKCDAVSGSALGPHWLAKLAQETSNQTNLRKLHVISEVELNSFAEKNPESEMASVDLPDSFLPNSTDWKLWAELNNGRFVGCDLIVEATGVVPNAGIWKQCCPELELAEDGGIRVDDRMRTNIPDVFAAGDVCTASWADQSSHWKQIRLWTQARQMGVYTARAMLIKELLLDIAFDLFSHVTTFFGFKVVLLGDFTGEQLKKPFEVNYRLTEGVEYVKVLTKDHRVHGAVLIGETELEETIENLILNQTDIYQIENNFLDPDIDLEDYFD